jgi:beta-barrel assembly-enhancing protease
MLRKFASIIIMSVLILSGCAINPVTGKQELTLVSETQEIQVGTEQYAPSRQMQGGDYVVEPELNQYVTGVGRKLSTVSDRQLPYEFSIINSSTPNAWALPGGKIAVNRGLLTELSNEAELAAVLGHEMVHAAARHGAKAMERGLLLQGAVMAAGIAVSDTQYAELGIVGAQLTATLLNQKYSRDAERESDVYGMEYMAKAGYDPAAAVTLQEVFVRLSEERRQDWLSGLFSSHPPSVERVAANREKAAALSAGGTLGVEKYRHMTARLRNNQKGYDAYDKGRKALSEGRIEEALGLAKNALAIEGKEGLFHALRGDVRYAQKKYSDALINYNRAVDRNPNFFHFYVQRGLARKKTADETGAEADFKKSLTLLPTSTAYKALGDTALARGNRQQALEYYKAASGSDSPSGKEAKSTLVRLDLPNQPNAYLKSGIGLGRDGYAYAQVVNPTPLAVKNVRLKVQYRDSAGRVREIPLYIRKTIKPGESAAVQLGFGQIKDPGVLKNMAVGITQAEVVESR